jgi:hypothetical protein
MFATRVALKATLSVVSAVALTAVALLTSGCSGFDMVGSQSTDTTPMAGAAIHGMVHGGRQLISGATIGLYVAGSSGYGSSGGTNLLGLNVVTTSDGTSNGADSNANPGNENNTLPLGYFTITNDYTCPGGSLVYLTSTGGDAGSGVNNAIQLVVPLGLCTNLTSGTFVVVNEVTTAATALALGQFISPASDNIGTSSTNFTVGLTNAFATVNSLVNTATGNAVTSSTLTNNSITVTAVPEYNKLNTIADVLAACVNSTGGAPCTTILFPDVTPTSATPPTDTFQAAVYMSQNPTSTNASTSATNLTALWGLATATPPFSYGSQTQPTDWTVGILYQDSATSLIDPQNIAADTSGNIWVLNGYTTAPVADGSLTELNATGTPQLNVTSIGGVSIVTNEPRNEAIDTNGNVWLTTQNTTIGSSTYYLYEYNPSPSTSIAFADSNGPYGVAIDGSNNVFVTHSVSGANTVNEFLGGGSGASATLAGTSEVEYALDGTANQPKYAAIDTNDNLWMTDGAGTNIFQMSGFNGSTACSAFPCTVGTPGDTTLTQTYTNITSPTMDIPWGLAAAAGGDVWFANSGTTSGTNPSTVTLMTSTSAGNLYGGYLTSLKQPEYIAVDGAGNLWVANKGTGSVSEFNSSGAILSPTTSTSSVYGFKHGVSGEQGITLDPSGNVWVAINTITTGGVFEIVGAATPTVTPIALALKNGKVGAKP